MRCLTLADALAKNNWHCAFACYGKALDTVLALSNSSHDIYIFKGTNEITEMNQHWSEGCDLLVVDHYEKDIKFESACRNWAAKIMVIDDLANRKHDGDILLDQTLGRKISDYKKLLPKECPILLGPSFALLRPQFIEARNKSLKRRSLTERVERVLVSMGASDPLNISKIVLEGIAQSKLDVKVDLVIGSSSPHMKTLKYTANAMPQDVSIHMHVSDMAHLMNMADLAIGAGGTTSWERCCLGLPSFIVITAENQFNIAVELEKAGAAIIIGLSKTLKPEDITLSLKENYQIKDMSLKSSGICDGAGVARVMEHLAA